MSAHLPSVRHARRAAASVCVVALSLFAGGAVAADVDAVKRVRYEDLDLDKSQDAARLYTRLTNAAQSACAYYDGSELYLKVHKRACVHKALSEAVAEIDHAAVTALHAASEERVRLAQTPSPRT